ncbi:MAG: hypothetical protein B7Z66_11550 [Chromatiales bacterium 21-64-14]|nr:MAG: hypothetical protein B7Z66_11550 [Chromatiales bacterium 21-64-14]HQU16714.1 transposase [Gammaproteobacteria bacterium]
MTRPLRLEFPGAVYHLTARGDRRADIFLDDLDRQAFLQLLAKEIGQQGWRLYAYCLMSNHYHLLVETPEANLTAGMRRLNGVYTQTFNRRHDRVGHVLQGRYKSILVDKEAYLLELARYIVLNPVRAGMVTRAGDWPWSSYSATAGKIPVSAWLEADLIAKSFADDPTAARQAYRRFVRAGISRPSPWADLRGQIYLGGEKFLARMERLAAAQGHEGIPVSHRQPTRPGPDTLLDVVADRFTIERDDVRDRKHQPAFQAWVYLLRRVANISLREAATHARISPARVSQIQRAVEEGTPAPELTRLIKHYKVKA